MPRFRGPLALCLSLALLVLLAGCDPEKQCTKCDDDRLLVTHPQSSPSNCLLNLIQACKGRNIDEYRKLFSDDFVFVFSPTDVADPNHPTPTSWGFADEIDATGNMFTSDTVDQISLSFGQTVAAPSDSVIEGSWRIYTTELRLAVDTRLADGSQLTMLVEGDLQAFYFRPYPEERASDGDTLWRIVRWDDLGGVEARAGQAMTEKTTWGQIKHSFLK